MPPNRPGVAYERRRGGAIRPLVALVVALACAGGLWFAYTHRRVTPVDSGDIPIIRAEQGPTRIRPQNPGGDAAPEEDDGVYNMGGKKEAPEHLLPPPEEPMERPGPTASALPPATPPAEKPPSQTTLAPILAPAPAASVAPPVASAAKPPQAPPAVPMPQTATAGGQSGPFRVQIAATKDEASAHSEWIRLQKAHADLLGGLALTVVRADIDTGTFYRIQAGAFGDRAPADKLCGQLKAVSITCMVVHGH